MAKQRVAVLFGGASSEHEVSRVSGAAVAEGLQKAGYEVIKIGITPKGRWLLFPGSTDLMRSGEWEHFPDCAPAVLSPDRTTRGFMVNHGNTLDIVRVDCVFPVLHGRNGEDGTVQGLLELSGLPYVGCNVLSSALCMDKAFANTVFDAANIPHTPWFAMNTAQALDTQALLDRVEKELAYPVFVKPAVGGSSVGISKVHSPQALAPAVQLALAHDSRIVFEQAVQGKEVECAVLGNQTLFATLPGEIDPCNEIYDYAAKYESGDASKLYLPARLPQHLLEQVRELALSAYRALDCSGLARVDFFVTDKHQILINEINTLPGFTPISMYAKLMDHAGIPFEELVDRLVQLAFERANV